MAVVAIHQFAKCITCHAWSPDQKSKIPDHGCPLLLLEFSSSMKKSTLKQQEIGGRRSVIVIICLHIHVIILGTDENSSRSWMLFGF